jgi:hypothetical protein
VNVTQQNLFADSRNTDNSTTNKSVRQAPQLEQLFVQGQAVYVCHSQSVSVVYDSTDMSAAHCLGSIWVDAEGWRFSRYNPDGVPGKTLVEAGATSMKTTIAKLLGQQPAQINDDRWTQVEAKQTPALKEVA